MQKEAINEEELLVFVLKSGIAKREKDYFYLATSKKWKPATDYERVEKSSSTADYRPFEFWRFFFPTVFSFPFPFFLLCVLIPASQTQGI